jgi:hypothetical protein
MAQKRKLSPTAIDELPHKDKLYDVYDAAVLGLAVRVAPKPSKRKTFVLVARFDGKNPTRRAIGVVGKMSLDAARTKARDWLGIVANHKDPAAVEEQRRKAELRKRKATFEAVAEEFIKFKLAKERQGRDAERTLRRELMPTLGCKPITGVGSSDIKAVVRAAVARGAEYRAHAILALAKRFFAWAIAEDEYGLETSPCDRLKPRLLIGIKRHRDRTLRDDELQAFWRATGRMSYPYRPLARLFLLVGQRHRELAKARRREFHPELVALWRKGEPVDWSRVPTEWKVWSVGAERFKSDAPHMVPLTDQVCEILGELPWFKSGDYLFTNTFGKKPTMIGDKIKKKIDARVLAALRLMARKRGDNPDEVSLDNWRNHDLRRTLRTRLSALKVDDHVSEMIIGHGRKGLQRVYDQHRYIAEMREALTKWNERLLEIVEPKPLPDNVVRLPAEAA